MLRRSGFFLLDKVHGSPVAKHIQLLAKAHQNPDFAAAYRAEAVQRLLEHATEHVSYYQQFRGVRELTQLPTLAKSTVQTRYQEFLSSQFDPTQLTSRSTSGSYGTPLAYLSSRDQALKLQAELIFYGRWAGYQVGMRYLLVNNVRQPSWLTAFRQNQLLLDPTRMDDAWLKNCVNTLRRRDVEFMIAQPSAIDTIRVYSQQHGIQLKGAMQGIIMVAEPCSRQLRQQFEDFYGCPVHGRYAATEHGLIAQQCRSNYHVNPLNHVVELLNLDNDQPAPLGTVGRVVITNLSALAMPLIRYETGDLAIERAGCDCEHRGMVLQEIIGRQVEVITDTSGNSILPTAFWPVWAGLKGFLQYQFIQHGKRDYEMRLVVSPEFHEADKCQASLKVLLGQDANIQIKLVDEILPLPSGKRPLVINLYRKQEQAR